MIRLLVATYNQGKLAEFSALLQGLPVEVVGPKDLGLTVHVHENGATYAENAQLKAEAFLSASMLPTLSDDSGLEVDALDGEPGVHSARYAGDHASDRERYELLLRRLAGVPLNKRTARFRCVLVLATPEGLVQAVEGVCEGLIAFEPCGEHGFGYDPVFFLPQQQCTMAQLTPEVKNQISHRANAARAIRPILERHVVAAGRTCPAATSKETPTDG